jgi:hypothetical protein
MANLLETTIDPRPVAQQQKDQKDAAQKSKKMREHQTEDQIDKTLKDSFPASDPPSTY